MVIRIFRWSCSSISDSVLDTIQHDGKRDCGVKSIGGAC